MTAPDPISSTTQVPPWVRFVVARSDRHRWMTVLALFGLGVAAAMAALGLPPIDLHGPFHRFGIMDPLCGGTRAARYTAQGELALAWKYNPLGIATIGAAVGVTLRAIAGLMTGRWLDARLAWTPRRTRLAVALIVLATLVLEVRQQLRADLLMGSS